MTLNKNFIFAPCFMVYFVYSKVLFLKIKASFGQKCLNNING